MTFGHLIFMGKIVHTAQRKHIDINDLLNYYKTTFICQDRCTSSYYGKHKQMYILESNPAQELERYQ